MSSSSSSLGSLRRHCSACANETTAINKWWLAALTNCWQLYVPRSTANSVDRQRDRQPVEVKTRASETARHVTIGTYRATRHQVTENEFNRCASARRSSSNCLRYLSASWLIISTQPFDRRLSAGSLGDADTTLCSSRPDRGLAKSRH